MFQAHVCCSAQRGHGTVSTGLHLVGSTTTGTSMSTFEVTQTVWQHAIATTSCDRRMQSRSECREQAFASVKLVIKAHARQQLDRQAAPTD